MSEYEADPRAEELQFLRQCQRAPIEPTHSATIAIAGRCHTMGEIHMVHGWAEISAAGRRALRSHNSLRAARRDDEARAL